MFEALKAANAARLTLGNMKGPASKVEHRAWSCTILFYGAIVGSASGSTRNNEFILVLNKGLQDQIIQTLVSNGFELDTSKVPESAIRPDSPTNFMKLAIAQISDEMDMVKELKAKATKDTLAILSTAPGKVQVFPYPYTPAIHADLVNTYGAENITILNEILKGL